MKPETIYTKVTFSEFDHRGGYGKYLDARKWCTGQITTHNASLAKGASVTFTVNNTFVTSVTDIPLVAIQSGATIDSYAILVTRVQVGSFNITLTNNGAGPLTDTIVINFAVMKIS